MTEIFPWADKTNYAYLDTLDAKQRARGWAWEFIRRNPIYREKYESFSHLQTKYGADWKKKQARDIHEPELLPGESERAWRIRASNQLLIVQKITASQKCARQWHLCDMYDPAWPYDKRTIRFEIIKQYPRIYGSDSTIKELPLDSIEDLQHDLVYLPTENILFVALDTLQPLKHQLPKLTSIFEQCKEPTTTNYKLHYTNFTTYIQLLDALDSGVDLNLTEIIKAIGVPKTRKSSNPAVVASECKEAAINMRDKGYIGLIRQAHN
jgi:hypothetical protein